jgi:hypothetical protein
VTGGAPAPVPIQLLDLASLEFEPSDPDWLIERRLTRQSLTFLGARPGVGKSWVAADLSHSLVTGRPWLGCEVPGPRRVLYLDAENGDALARRRLRQLGVRMEAVGDRLAYSTEALSLPGRDSDRVLELAARHAPDLVVLDTLASHAPSAETDSEAASLFLHDVWHGLRQLGCSLLVLHHLRKMMQGGRRDDSIDSFRGSGHLVASASRAWLLNPHGAGSFTLSEVKDREWTAQPPVRLQLVDELSTEGLSTRIEVVGTDSGDFAKTLDAVLAHLDDQTNGQARAGDLVRMLEGQGIPERTAKRHLSRAVNEHALSQPRRGVYAAPS